nr:MAG TPA: hypothetical protein [Bacteriophage sp.]
MLWFPTLINLQNKCYSILYYPVVSCLVLFFDVFYFFYPFHRHINVGSLPLLHS